MSTLQFPKNPSINDEYDWEGFKYVYDGQKWKTIGVGYNPVNDLKDKLEPRIDELEDDVTHLQSGNSSLVQAVNSLNVRVTAEEKDTKDWEGFTAELLAQGGVPDNGQPDELGNSQRVEAIKKISGRRVTTVAAVEAGSYKAGDKLTLSDRAGANFDVVDGGTPNGDNILNAGSGNTATLVSTAINRGVYYSIDGTGDETVSIQNAIDNDPSKYVTLDNGDYTVSSDVEGTVTSNGGTGVSGGFVNVVNIAKRQAADQTDFVSILRDFKPFKNQFRVYDTNGNVDVMCIYPNGRYVQYYFSFVNGAYVTQGTSYTGKWVTASFGETGTLADGGMYSGTWVQSTEAINGYTTQTGATWEGTVVGVAGQSIASRHQTRTDGGKFQVTVREGSSSGALVNSLVIDTYNTVATKKVFTLVEEAQTLTYWVKYEFIGTSPERGWITSLASNLIFSSHVIYNPLTSEFITTPSNKDFAIEVAPIEAPTSFEFIPAHSGVVTDFEKAPRKYILDGVEVDVSIPQVKFFNNFKLVQHIYFKTTTTSPSRELGEVRAAQEINEFGELVMTGYLQPNEQLVYGNGYTMMHVGHLETSDYLITGLGRKVYITVPTSSTNIPLRTEADSTVNYCYVGASTGSTVQNLCGAMRVENPYTTWRNGKANKPDPFNMTYLQLRTSSVAKIYCNIFNKPYISDEKIAWRGVYKYINDDNLDLYVNAF